MRKYALMVLSPVAVMLFILFAIRGVVIAVNGNLAGLLHAAGGFALSAAILYYVYYIYPRQRMELILSRAASQFWGL